MLFLTLFASNATGQSRSYPIFDDLFTQGPAHYCPIHDTWQDGSFYPYDCQYCPLRHIFPSNFGKWYLETGFDVSPASLSEASDPTYQFTVSNGNGATLVPKPCKEREIDPFRDNPIEPCPPPYEFDDNLLLAHNGEDRGCHITDLVVYRYESPGCRDSRVIHITKQ